MRKMMVLAGVAALAIGGVAVAQQVDQPRPARGDADGDGRVSEAEFIQARVARVTALDANRDGTIMPDEARAAAGARLTERRAQRFTRIDSNGDGSITRAEWDAAEQQRGERRAERAERRGGAMDGGRLGRQRGMGPARAAMRLDRDENGVTVAEVQQKASEQFARLDGDRDGFVTPAERMARREARSERREARQSERAERRAARQAERSAPAQ